MLVLVDRKLGEDKVNVDVFNEVDWLVVGQILDVLTVACVSSLTEQETNVERLASS